MVAVDFSRDLIKFIWLADGDQNRVPQGPPRDDAEPQAIKRVEMLGHAGFRRVNLKIDMLEAILQRQCRANLRRGHDPAGNQAFPQRHIKFLLVLQCSNKVSLINRARIDQYPTQGQVFLDRCRRFGRCEVQT